MSKREREIIKFCREQKVDEEISKAYNEADKEEAIKLINQWLGMTEGMFYIPISSYEWERAVGADLRSEKDKEEAFENIQKCLREGYNKKLQFVGVYNEQLNAVTINFWRINDIDIRTVNVTMFIPEWQMNQLCAQLNALMK